MMFLIGALAGLMVIGNVQNFAKSPTDGFTANGFGVQEAIDFAVIGAAVCLPIFNGAGQNNLGANFRQSWTRQNTNRIVRISSCNDDNILLHNIKPNSILRCCRTNRL